MVVFCERGVGVEMKILMKTYAPDLDGMENCLAKRRLKGGCEAQSTSSRQLGNKF
jgi:hypothetical protein